MKLFAISDLHFSPYTKWGDFGRVIRCAEKEAPDYIVIAGDIFNCISDFYADGVAARGVKALTQLAKVAPVVAVVGNHDYAWQTGVGTEKMYRDERMFARLKKIPNFHLLENEWLRTDKVDFYGMEKDGDYYYPKEDGRELAETLAGIKVDKGKVSVLLFHSPMVLAGLETDFDVTFSGHMHEGMVPSFARWVVKKLGTRGLVGPYMKWLPKHVFSKGQHIVLPAWEAVPARPRGLRIFRVLYKRRGVVVEIDPVEKSMNLVEKIL